MQKSRGPNGELIPLPVKGYTDQPISNIEKVNANKETEERILRQIENDKDLDHRWAAIARTHFEQGFMALNRAIFKPQRVQLEE